MVKLSDIVNNFLMENELGESEYIRAYQIGRSGLSTLTKDIKPYRDRICLQVRSDNSVEIPLEVGKVSKVGIMEGGRFKAYTLNTALGKNLDRCSGCKRGYADCTCSTDMYQDGLSRSLGVGSWTVIGEYNIVNRVIYLSPQNTNTEIVIEGTIRTDLNGDVVVDDILEESVQAYITWRYFRSKRGQQLSVIRDYEMNYKEERRKAKLRKNSVSRSQLNQISRQNTKQGLKS